MPQLPTIPNGEYEYRSMIENHIVDVLRAEYKGRLGIQKYWNTSNQQIYEDALNSVSSGIPYWLVRTKRERAEDNDPSERTDWKECTIEILNTVPVSIEKKVINVDRYSYTMVYLLREQLRENPIKIPNNRRRPFKPVGNRDIFRDDQLDIVLSEFKVNYMVL